MSYIPEEVIQDIRQKTDIVDVINQYVQLTKKGTNYSASCPFHEDRNPSFSVHPGKQIYKCFSCGRGGNVFGFLQEIEGINFVASVQNPSHLQKYRRFHAEFPAQTSYTPQPIRSHPSSAVHPVHPCSLPKWEHPQARLPKQYSRRSRARSAKYKPGQLYSAARSIRYFPAYTNLFYADWLFPS